jgi:aminoglycoside phosphotransferase (APT) family kinase protein
MIDPALFAELKELCLRSFPERLDQRLSQIEPVTRERHPTLALTLSWQEGVRLRVERLLLRRYSDAWTWWSFQDAHKAQREWAVIRWLYARGLPVPEPYALGSESAEPFVLLARTPGRPGASLLDACAVKRTPVERQPAGNPRLDLEQCLDAFGILIAKLHHLTAPDAVRDLLPRITVLQELARMADIARQCEDRELIRAVNELGPSAQEMEAYPPCVLHGDPQLANLLYDARGITTWLNWENSALGDPRWDIAYAVDQLRDQETTQPAESLYDAYVTQIGQQLSDMAFWEALVTVHRWAITCSVQATAPAQDTQTLSVELEQRRGQAWRALTRWHRNKREHSAPNAQPDAVAPSITELSTQEQNVGESNV